MLKTVIKTQTGVSTEHFITKIYCKDISRHTEKEIVSSRQSPMKSSQVYHIKTTVSHLKEL